MRKRNFSSFLCNNKKVTFKYVNLCEQMVVTNIVLFSPEEGDIKQSKRWAYINVTKLRSIIIEIYVQ